MCRPLLLLAVGLSGCESSPKDVDDRHTITGRTAEAAAAERTNEKTTWRFGSSNPNPYDPGAGFRTGDPTRRFGP